MKRFDFKKRNGFIALISTVIISAILLAAAVSASRASFWARFDLLARENKKISAAMAEGCVQAALLKIAKNENINVPGECANVEISESNPHIIIARANWKNSYTNLKVTAKLVNDELEISDWREF